MNRARRLQEYGQSIWLDHLQRSLMTSGKFHRLVEEIGITGVTTNPTIFQKAIACSTDYDDEIRQLTGQRPELSVQSLFERLAIRDIRMAADTLRAVYDRTCGDNGFVSFELSPHLARDFSGSISEARRLWKEINRPNVMIKIPATPEGIRATEVLVAEEVNVNVTLLFCLHHYEAAANAYMRGLGQCRNPVKVASVASFFVSRIDVIVDQILSEIGSPVALSLRGKTAISSARTVYERHRELFSSEAWQRLAERGARIQRLVWASMGTKNQSSSDVVYAEELIGQDTFCTLPPSTLQAFLDHGRARRSLIQGFDEAKTVLKRLSELGIDLDAIPQRLLQDGLNAFVSSWTELLSALESKRSTNA